MRVQFRRLTEADLPKIMRMNQDFRQGFADPEATQRFLQILQTGSLPPFGRKPLLDSPMGMLCLA